ncbi:2-succinyl-5-enolpyruvyl-6-hydroxy-3-cyclohexene-1-carboxylate synthase [Durusdinium trenchii]|uniref:2-succinyl-5-enolpyruvyl-6-hydroxy-3-cyclohexene-1-carboxylate synthase n=1 Tax=Durusdinium trenchii TaxID=1381693 RepID=A0ABP0S5T1_9DINO
MGNGSPNLCELLFAPHCVGRVIGPLVGEVLGACDARLEGEEPGLVIYVVEAASLVCLQAALEATAPVAPWPSWGASLQLELWEVEGQLSLSLRPREELDWTCSTARAQIPPSAPLPYLPFRQRWHMEMANG